MAIFRKPQNPKFYRLYSHSVCLSASLFIVSCVGVDALESHTLRAAEVEQGYAKRKAQVIAAFYAHIENVDAETARVFSNGDRHAARNGAARYLFRQFQGIVKTLKTEFPKSVTAQEQILLFTDMSKTVRTFDWSLVSIATLDAKSCQGFRGQSGKSEGIGIFLIFNNGTWKEGFIAENKLPSLTCSNTLGLQEPQIEMTDPLKLNVSDVITFIRERFEGKC